MTITTVIGLIPALMLPFFLADVIEAIREARASVRAAEAEIARAAPVAYDKSPARLQQAA